MRAYELMVILVGDLEEAAANAQIDAITARIGEAGTVRNTDRWGKRTFAYEIDHRTDGYYVVFEIEAEPGALDPLERSLRLADEVVRHKLLRLPEHEAHRRGLLVEPASS